MTRKREIRVFCPIHQASFKVIPDPHINCEITGHALATELPGLEFWEFCCNCETFSPSGLEKGEKAEAHCKNCRKEVTERFVCLDCKTMSFTCKGDARGQEYFVRETGISPNCPSCGRESYGKLKLHKCDHVDTEFRTARDRCPFCLNLNVQGLVEKTPSILVPPPPPPPRFLGSDGKTCQQCNAHVPVVSAMFCPKCGSNFMDVTPASVPRPQPGIIPEGSIECENCFGRVDKNLIYCNECGHRNTSSNH